MDALYLVLTGCGTERRLSTSSDVHGTIANAGGQACRLSPIFPVVLEASDADPLKDCSYIGFFCPLQAFEFIGKQPKPIRERLWFSHGLASTIRFGKTKEEVLQTIEGQDSEIAAYEIWSLNAGVVEIEEQWTRPVGDHRCVLTTFSDLSKDARRLLEEIQVSMHEAARCASIYMPEQLTKLQRITVSVNELINELRYFEDPVNRPVPVHFSKKTPISAEDPAFHQRINQSLSHLIALNSALSYAVSQTSHGAVPILKRPCLIATYSLLGIGTAYRAVSSVAGYVEGVFEKHPILWVLDKSYRSVNGVEVFADAVRYKVQDWRDAATGIDNFLPKSQQELSRPKLAFFSSRLGFGEAHFSVTAAAQVLHAADTVRWSLMTLTHELLHSHVTGILATIFSETEADCLSQNLFNKYHTEFKEWAKNGQKGTPLKLLDCLRYIIFNFSLYRQKALLQVRNLADTTASADIGSKLPEDAEIFRSIYSHSLRLLEEIIVHTLDLRYFYRGDHDLFLELLWESWTTVPAVVGDLETYILRSLVTIATLEHSGSVSDRYKLAREKLTLKLRALCKRNVRNIFLRKALEHVENSGKSKRLILLFYSALYIADMAATFLFSETIEAAFWSNDTNIEPSTSGLPNYALETGAFNGEAVSNPIPFLASRLREEF